LFANIPVGKHKCSQTFDGICLNLIQHFVLYFDSFFDESSLHNFICTFGEAFYLLVINSLRNDAHHFPCATKLKVSDGFPNFCFVSNLNRDFGGFSIYNFGVIILLSHVKKNFFILAGALESSIYSDSIIADQNTSKDVV
jgi:hypothetical protein